MGRQQTQREWVLGQLRNGGTLTPFDAFVGMAITRLGGIIFDLRQDGFAIADANVSEVTGKRLARHSAYYLQRLRVDDPTLREALA